MSHGYLINYVPKAIVYHSHPISVSGMYRRWYWRSRHGIYLRRHNDWRVDLAHRFTIQIPAVIAATSFFYVQWFIQSLLYCLKKGYLGDLWKLPFYETVREYARHGIIPMVKLNGEKSDWIISDKKFREWFDEVWSKEHYLNSIL